MSKHNGNSVLSPELKSWIDGVIVPALLKEYMAELERDESACSKPKPVKHSTPIPVSAEEGE